MYNKYDWKEEETEGDYRINICTQKNERGYFYLQQITEREDCWLAYHQGKLVRQIFESLDEAKAYCDRTFTESI